MTNWPKWIQGESWLRALMLGSLRWLPKSLRRKSMKDSSMAIPPQVPGWAQFVSFTVLSTFSEDRVWSQSIFCKVENGWISRGLVSFFKTSHQNMNKTTIWKFSPLTLAFSLAVKGCLSTKGNPVRNSVKCFVIFPLIVLAAYSSLGEATQQGTILWASTCVKKNGIFLRDLL